MKLVLLFALLILSGSVMFSDSVFSFFQPHRETDPAGRYAELEVGNWPNSRPFAFWFWCDTLACNLDKWRHRAATQVLQSPRHCFRSGDFGH